MRQEGLNAVGNGGFGKRDPLGSDSNAIGADRTCGRMRCAGLLVPLSQSTECRRELGSNNTCDRDAGLATCGKKHVDDGSTHRPRFAKQGCYMRGKRRPRIHLDNRTPLLS